MEQTIKTTVDRREGDFFVCLAEEGDGQYLVPVDKAPLCEGAVALLTYRDGALLSVAVDRAAGRARKQENSARLHALFKKKK